MSNNAIWPASPAPEKQRLALAQDDGQADYATRFMQMADQELGVELIAHRPIGRDDGAGGEGHAGKHLTAGLLAGQRRGMVERQLLAMFPRLAPKLMLVLERRRGSGRGRQSRWHV